MLSFLIKRAPNMTNKICFFLRVTTVGGKLLIKADQIQ